jgi:O-antigen/teichoic acid export membrane protein
MKKKISDIYKSSSANRTAINTVIIYLQRFFAAGLSLITTPIILNSLGVKDYGLYTLTIGLVGMLSFLNWSLSSSTQRYIAYAIGEKNDEKLKKIFSTSLVIHFFYGLVLLVLISFIGCFFVDQVLNIPSNRFQDAKNVLYVVSGITFINIISIPFLGVLRANENFIAISILGIVESLLKLGIALTMFFLIDSKLIIYAFLLLFISIIVFVINYIIVNKNYKKIEISFKFYDSHLVKEMMSFFSWSLLGALAIMSRNEGVQVLINMFFGVVKNAAYGIAMQVSGAMSILAQGIIGSISPQIIKSAGAGEINKMIFLMRTMSKFATFSISLVAIPLFFECPSILKFWLHTVPEGTIIYIRYILIFGQAMLLSAGIQTVFDAIGKVKMYNIWVSIILMLNLPISYLLFKLNYPSYSIILVGIILEMLSLNVRLLLLKKYVELSIKEFYCDTLFRVFLPTIFMGSLIYLISLLDLNVLVELVLAFSLNLLFYPLIIYKFSLEVKQKELLDGMLRKILKK